LWNGSVPEYDDCEIWEAARATSAAPFYFPGIRIGPNNHKFWDGGLANNNPVDEVWAEKSLLFEQKEVKLIISLGTGQCETIKSRTKLLARHPAISKGGRLLANLTNVENVYGRFEDLMGAEKVEYFALILASSMKSVLQMSTKSVI